MRETNPRDPVNRREASMQRSFMINIVSALYLLTGSAVAQSVDKIGSQPREATMVDIPASAPALDARETWTQGCFSSSVSLGDDPQI